MSSRASISKHPLHPMLIPFPIALWIFSFVCDLTYAMGWGGPLWNDMAFYTMAGGIVGALVAAVPGLVDFLSLTDRQTKKIAMTHLIMNVVLIVVFGMNLCLRLYSAQGAALPIVLSALGVFLLGISGWLGGELVYVHGVAVEHEPRPASQGIGAAEPRRSSKV